MNDMFAPVVKALAQKAAAVSVSDPSDYMGEDGLIHCGKCGTPKQCRIDYPEPMTVFCMCACAAEKFNRERERENLRRRAENALADAFDDPMQRNWDIFSTDDGKTPQISEAIRRYCDNFDEFRREGRGLLLWSKNSGSGKSYCAASVVNELCRRGIRCRMTTFGHIFSDLQSTYRWNKADYIELLTRYELLVLDDLSAERTSEWASENIFNVIDGRYRAKKPTIITTNLEINEIKAPESREAQRIYDRILEMCHPIHVDCRSRRKTFAASEYAKTRDILGI